MNADKTEALKVFAYRRLSAFIGGHKRFVHSF
jgi:hypothetical protein